MTDKGNTKELSMFYPKTKQGLLHDYPELKKIEEFKKLNKHEILFVWYFACKASPFDYEENARIKTEKALLESFGERKAEQMKDKFIAGNFSEKIRYAIAEMRKFEIGPRVRAKMMVENIMSNYEKLVDVKVDGTEFTNKDGEVDWSKKKAYIDACKTVSSTLPVLINQAEGSFGIVERDDGEEVILNSDDLIDEFHENQE